MWFSATLGIDVWVGPDRLADYCYCVIIFKAKSWENAKERAISYGKSTRTEYKNVDQKDVVWQLREVVTLDLLEGFKAAHKDVVEVCWHYASAWPHLEQLRNKGLNAQDDSNPEASEPTQSL